MYVRGNYMKENIYQKKIKEWTKKYGGLSSDIQRKIDKLVAEYDKTQRITKDNKILKITTGTKLVREFNGKLYSVFVADTGFEFNGQLYKSLSAIANTITGKHWKEFKSTSNEKLLEHVTYKVKIILTPSRKNKIIIQGENNYDIRLINAIVQSFWFNNKCANGELTRKEKLNGNNNRFKNLRFLPPNIIEDIINGKNDPDITVQDLLKIAG